MLDHSIDQNSFFNTALAARRAEELHPDGHQVWKTVTITQFPSGVEVFIDEAKSTWSDPVNFEPIEKSARGEGDREVNQERAARRARSAVRKRCKMIQANQMLTLTYRENMTDMARLQVDFKAFVSRVRTLGDFEYVACAEEQKRGALHIHLACQSFPKFLNIKGMRLKSYNVLRAIWRSVVGHDNGAVNLTRPRRNAAHRIACYISKYISKTISEATFNKKSYWSSRGIPKPTKTVLWFSGDTDSFELVSMIAHDFFARGYHDIAQFASRPGAFLWFSAGKPL